MDLIKFVASCEVKGGGEQRGFSLALDGDGDLPAVGVDLIGGPSRGDPSADGGGEAKHEGGRRSSRQWWGGLRRGGRPTMMVLATELGVGSGVYHLFISRLVTVKSLLYTGTVRLGLPHNLCVSRCREGGREGNRRWRFRSLQIVRLEVPVQPTSMFTDRRE
ncbi:hypothetical protein U1Q18_021224 [Sarracenia purpurea var. burkii]